MCFMLFARERWNSAHELAFALHHNKESTMENSDGTGASTTPADAARRVKDAAGTVKEAAIGVVERGKQAATDAASKGAERASNMADSTASALRRAAEDVEGDNRLIGTALRKSAESIERAAQSFQGGDISRAMDDLNGFARRQPALFLGASLALGFALARVGKTAIEQATEADLGDAARTPMPEI
jgi:hypothetical protein